MTELKPNPETDAFARPVRLIVRYWIFLVSLSRFWCTVTSKVTSRVLLRTQLTWVLVILLDHASVGNLLAYVYWNRHRHYFRLDILWSVESCYWQGRFSALQVQCRYDWLIQEKNENPESLIAATLRRWFSLSSFMRTTGSPCVMFVATAVVASEAPI